VNLYNLQVSVPFGGCNYDRTTGLIDRLILNKHIGLTHSLQSIRFIICLLPLPQHNAMQLTLRLLRIPNLLLLLFFVLVSTHGVAVKKPATSPVSAREQSRGPVNDVVDDDGTGGIYGYWLPDTNGLPSFEFTMDELTSPNASWPNSQENLRPPYNRTRTDHFYLFGNKRINVMVR